jgi:hypothetical protein
MDKDQEYIIYKAKRLKICKVPNCNKSVNALGYCSHHYYKFKKYGDPIYNEEASKIRKKRCSIEGCNTVTQARGLCCLHYQQYLYRKKKQGNNHADN